MGGIAEVVYSFARLNFEYILHVLTVIMTNLE